MQNIKSVFRFIISAHICALLFFALHRGIELFVCREMLQDATTGGDIFICFLRGMAFDTRCSCEALAIPSLILIIMSLLGKESKRWQNAAVWIAMVIYFVEFGICYANVPYVQYQQTNMNFAAIQTLGMGTEVAGMMFTGEYLFFTILTLVMSASFCAIIWSLGKKLDIRNRGGRRAILKPLGCSLGIIFLLFVGIRGRMSHTAGLFPGWPLKEGFANFSSDPIANLICLNPWFGLERDIYLNGKVEKMRYEYMADEDAERIAFGKQNYPQSISDSAVAKRPHVFFIMMESMSAHAMERFGCDERLTPFLDSLFGKAQSYSQCYSGGTQTNVAMFCATTSQQVVMSMRMTDKPQQAEKYVTRAFKKAGYRAFMYVPHLKGYDNINGFYLKSGMDNLYDLEDYGIENKVNEWGVSDGFLFDYVFKELEAQTHQDTTPIFTYILTCSNHPTIVLPSEFMGKHKDERRDAVAYSDEMVGRFYKKVRETEWGRDAMFVIMGDHGFGIGAPEAVSPCYLNHIPLIIDAPGITEAKEDARPATQADVLPTILSTLGIRYEEYCGTGVDMFHTDRDTIYYTNSKLCVARTADRVYAYNPFDETKEVYDIVNTNDGNHPTTKRAEKQEDEAMDKFVKANIQATFNRVVR